MNSLLIRPILLFGLVLKLALILVLCATSACSLLQPKPKNLLSTTSDTQTIVAQQQWQLVHQQERYLLQVFVERTADHWQWILMSNLGQRIATVSATKGIISIEQHQSHPANQWLAELLEAYQFSYWPLGDLQEHAPQGWSFAGDSAHRDIRFSGILRATIDYQPDYPTGNPWQGRLSYDNKKSQLQLVIESQLLN